MRSIRYALPLAALLTAAALADPGPPAPAYVNHTADVPEAVSQVYCVSGDTLHLAGPYTNMGYGQSFLEADHYVSASSDVGIGVGIRGRYSYDWQARDPGVYRLRVGFRREHGGADFLRAVTVRVLTAAPVTLGPVPDSAYLDTTVVAYARGGDFVPQRGEFRLDGAPIAAGGALSVNAPFGSEPTGVHTLGLCCYDASGAFFDVGSRPVATPERVTLGCPGVYTLGKQGDRMPLAVSLAPGVPAVSVAYFVDGQKVADAQAAPYAASGDLSALSSGTHQVYARVMLAGGAAFSSPTLPLVFKNQPDDEAAAKTAKEQADRAAAVQIAQARAAEADAQAKAAEESRKEQGPTGPARKILRAYFASHPALGLSLVDVKDVRKSDSEIYPSDVYAIVQQQGGTANYVYSVNTATQEVSDLVRSW